MPIDNRVAELNRRIGGIEESLNGLPHIIGQQIGQQVQQILGQRHAPPFAPPRQFAAPQGQPWAQQPPNPYGAPPAVDLSDPELQALDRRVESRLAQTESLVGQVLGLLQQQTTQQQAARGQQMAQELAKDFNCFGDPDLGPQYLSEFVQTRSARPWASPQVIAQQLQERHDRLVTRIAGNASRPPSAAAPGAAAVPGGGPPAPVVATQAPVGAKAAGQLVQQALAQAGRQ